jgi:hypothetical protein
MKKYIILATLMASMLSFAQDSAPQPPQRQGQGPRGGMLVAMDADKDGKVTKAEMNAWFDKLDTNKDGVLAAEELRTARPQGAGGPPANRGQGKPPQDKK